MSGETPRLTAAVDQHLATLRDLVQMVRDHRDAECNHTVLPCPGAWAMGQLEAMSPHAWFGLLGFALVELAALGYGLPTAADHIELTEHGLQVLDDDKEP